MNYYIYFYEKFLIMTHSLLNNSSNTSITNVNYNLPRLIDVIYGADYIELVYFQNPTYWTSSPNIIKQVYKIKYSCVDGKWNKSQPIYGKYIPASDESYEFE